MKKEGPGIWFWLFVQGCTLKANESKKQVKYGSKAFL
jgi:hypothetical protein